MKVLITRTDRLGDVILASPTWQALKEERPDARVTLLTRRTFLPLFEADPLLDAVIALPGGGRKEVDELARHLSSLDFDALLALYVDRPVARLVRKVSAPLKAGPLSKPRTWFLFNRPLRQRRSDALLHEADYNGRLLATLGVTYRPRKATVHLSPAEVAREEEVLRRLLGRESRTPFLVVHPGMGGSALNWPVKRYESLVQALLKERGEQIVITGTSADAPYLGSVTAQSHPRLIDAVGRIDLVELALLLRRARLFVGPSTGPMHLATALDTPVVTLFSPLLAQHPRRWGPYHCRATTLTPPVQCVQRHRCPGRRCRHFDCMDRISVGEVLAAVKSWLD